MSEINDRFTWGGMMRITRWCAICCVAITACIIDATKPTPSPSAVGPLLDFVPTLPTPTFLDPSPGYDQLSAIAISDKGHIIGHQVDAFGGISPFIERNGQRTPPPLFPGHSGIRLTAVNGSGVVVGYAVGPPSPGAVVVYWEPNKPSLIPGVIGFATDISETGWIVGYGTVPPMTRARAFVWRRGWPNVRFVGDTVPGTVSYASGVNNAGYIAGCVGDNPAIWTPSGSVQIIPWAPRVLGGCAAEINDALQVVGTVHYFNPETLFGWYRAFVWTKGQPMLLLQTSPIASTRAYDIDRDGRVYVVHTIDSMDLPLVWSAGAWLGLPGYISTHGIALDANDCGGVVASLGGYPSSMLWLKTC